MVGVHAKDHTGMNSGTRCCGWSVTHDQIRSVCMHEIGMVEHYDLGLASKYVVGGSISSSIELLTPGMTLKTLLCLLNLCTHFS